MDVMCPGVNFELSKIICAIRHNKPEKAKAHKYVIFHLPPIQSRALQ